MKMVHLFFCIVAIFVATNRLHAQGTAFTYQGQLNDGAKSANGNYDLKFALFDALAGGNGVGGPINKQRNGRE